MALELRQNLKLAQKLVMTPQLQQAIKLLQLSRLELTEALQAEIEQNPMLEEALPQLETPANPDVGGVHAGAGGCVQPVRRPAHGGGLRLWR